MMPQPDNNDQKQILFKDLFKLVFQPETILIMQKEMNAITSIVKIVATTI